MDDIPIAKCKALSSWSHTDLKAKEPLDPKFLNKLLALFF